MDEKDLLSRFTAWMDLHKAARKGPILECKKSEKGECIVEAFIPGVEKTVRVVDKEPQKAIDKFFIEAVKEIDKYLEGKPEQSEELNQKSLKIQKKTRNEVLKKRDEKLLNVFNPDVTTDKFYKDLEIIMRILENAITDVSYVLNEKRSNLYVKTLNRSFFEENMSADDVSLEMQYIIRKELQESKLTVLFTQCKVTDEYVLAFAVTETF